MEPKSQTSNIELASKSVYDENQTKKKKKGLLRRAWGGIKKRAGYKKRTKTSAGEDELIEDHKSDGTVELNEPEMTLNQMLESLTSDDSKLWIIPCNN